MKILIALSLLFSLSAFAKSPKATSKVVVTPSATPTEAPKVQGNPIVMMETDAGTIELELFQDKAPISVANFLSYVDKGHYNGTIFHRVINGFMIQGGGLDKDMNEKKVGSPIKNEATNGLQNEAGTLAMARMSAPDSATAQFFINVENNSFLDHRDNGQGFGYAVFGKVKSGMSVVSKIKMAKTGNVKGYSDVPLEPIIIKSMKRK
jgi:cyclophilin family peptidyl-prolyl cis-trans isomerase